MIPWQKNKKQEKDENTKNLGNVFQMIVKRLLVHKPDFVGSWRIWFKGFSSILRVQFKVAIKEEAIV